MSIVDRTERGQVETIVFELELEHAPAKVWRALTEPELLEQWLLPVVGFELAPGASFELHAPPQPSWDGKVRCRVVEIEPGRKLRYTWTVPFLDTVVTFTVTPIGTGTHLRIEQTGFMSEQKRESGGARFGWRMMGGRLIELLATLT